MLGMLVTARRGVHACRHRERRVRACSVETWEGGARRQSTKEIGRQEAAKEATREEGLEPELEQSVRFSKNG